MKDLNRIHHRVSSKIPIWYSPELTVREMAKAAGKKPMVIYNTLITKNLPYKKVRQIADSNLKDWYDKKLTVRQMARISGTYTSAIYTILNELKLPYKKEVHHKILSKPSWYDPTLSLRQMAEKAGLSHESIRQIIISSGLSDEYFKKKQSIKDAKSKDLADKIIKMQGQPAYIIAKTLCISEKHVRTIAHKYNLQGIIKDPLNYDDLSWWYDANKTVPEMAKQSGVKAGCIRNALIRLNLPYKRVRMVRNSDLTWYSPDKTVKQMSKESGKSYDNVLQLLKTRDLPYKPIYQKR